MRPVFALLLVVAACETTTDPAPRGDAGAMMEASTEIPDASGNGGSFDPSIYPTDCEGDSDCIRVPHLTQCSSCCSGDVAVKRVPAERDLATAVGACHEQTQCALACPALAAVCVDKRCVLQQNDAGVE